MYDIDSSLVDTYVEYATPCEEGDEKNGPFILQSLY